MIQLSPGRDVHIGRERGDWIFPYDPSMSAQHATVRSEDADFVLLDDHSRNGVAISGARGDGCCSTAPASWWGTRSCASSCRRENLPRLLHRVRG